MSIYQSVGHAAQPNKWVNVLYTISFVSGLLPNYYRIMVIFDAKLLSNLCYVAKASENSTK